MKKNLPRYTYVLNLKRIFMAVCLLVMNVVYVKAQAPSISYAAGAKTFTTGTTITSLSPSNTGGAVSAPGSVAVVTTIAGSGTATFADGTGSSASFYNPIDVALDANGNMYVADIYNQRIRKITPAGVVTTLAGGNYGFVDGTGTGASFAYPYGVAVDGNGNVYVADNGNNCIRKITPTGVVTTFAGSGTAGSTNGTGSAATFKNPSGVCVDANGNVYVADAGNSLIRKITSSGVVTTLAGSSTNGFTDGTGTGASLSNPVGICVDGSGNVYVGDTWNHSIRKITPTGVVTTLAGNGTAGSANGTGSAATFYYPYHVAVDANGNVFVADNNNNLIRKVTSAGVVTTLAGSGTAAYTDADGTSASFNAPRGAGIDASGNVYVADFNNNRIRKISTGGYSITPALPAGLSFNTTTGVISGTPTVATEATDYVVTATNASGSSSYTINIQTVDPATVNALDKVGLTSATPAAAAYSLRLLSSSYTGPLVRITIGNSYYDVYPDATTGKFALTSPISAAYTSYYVAKTGATANTLSDIISGATSASVAIWFDQSGNSNDLVQATTSLQPGIINSGVIVSNNNSNSIAFDNGLGMATSSNTLLSSSPLSVNIVAISTSTQAVYRRFIQGKANNWLIGPYANFVQYYAAGWNYAGVQQWSTTNWTSATAIQTATSSSFAVNNQIVASNQTNIGGLGGIALGNQGAYSESSLGNITEVVTFSSALSTADRNTLETNQINNFLQVPTISSFTPNSGAASTSVTITGNNFNTTAANNIVFFGATKATVTAASGTSLTVTVPAGATYGPITVLNTGTNLQAISTAYFTPVFSPTKGNITGGDISSKVDFTTGSGPYYAAIGDLDGDGKPDLAVVNHTDNTVSVYRNTSSSGSITGSSFAAKVDFTTGTSPTTVAIGDLDGDGKPDLAVTNGSDATVSIFRNTSSSGSITSSSFAAKVDFTTGTSPYTVAIGDLDGDGKPDVAVSNEGSNTVSVLRNTSSSGSITSSSFATKVDFTTGPQPTSVVMGDLDGDGKPDLTIVNYSSSNTISVLHNTSGIGSITSSSFASKVDFTTGAQPTSVAIGDLDGDGKPDLAVANLIGQTVSVLRNTSSSGSITSSSFASNVDFTTGSSTYSVAIGDLDGDGKPDLAVANYGSATVSVLRNTSSSGSITSSSFASKVDFTTGTQPISVAIGDLDGDGKPDLAVANYNNNTVSVLRNNPQPAPTISSFTPNVGCYGTSVTISGANFTGSTAVSFGGTNAASFTVVNSTTITAIVGGGKTGTIQVTTPNGTGSSSSSYTYASGYTLYAYVPSSSGSAVNIINTTNNTVSSSITSANGLGTGTWGVCSSPDGSKVYVSNNSNHSVSVINTSTNTVTATVSVGTYPQGIAISPDGSTVYVANNGGNTVSVINTSNNTVSATITVGANPGFLVVSPDGTKLYVSNAGSNTISVINTATNTVSTSISVNSPNGICIKPDGSTLYVVNNVNKTLSVVNTSTYTISTTINIGKNPYAAAISPDGNTVYVGNGDDGTISVINTSTNTVSATIVLNSSISSSPGAISVSPDGSSVYVADYFPNFTVINAANNTIVSQFALGSYGQISSGNFLVNVPTTCPIKWLGTTSSDWNTTTNWISGSIPVSTDSVIIATASNQPIIGTGVNAVAQKVTIQNGTELTLTGTGTLNVNTITVNPGGSLVGSSSNITGTVTVQQSISAQRGWRVLANPFSTATTIATVASTNGIAISTTPDVNSGLTDSRTYDNGSGNWSNVTGSTWASNTPYSLFYRGLSGEVTGANYTSGPSGLTYNVSGTLNGSSISIAPLSSSNFMVVGNPYAAPVNTAALTGQTTGIPYYTYQVIITGTPRVKSGSWVASSGNSNTTTTIPVLGVLAYLPSNTSSYAITTSDINTTGTAQTSLFGGNEIVKQLELDVEQNGYFQDKLFVRMDKQATNSAHDRVDLRKLYNDNVNVYTINANENERLAVDARAALGGEVPLGISALHGIYSITVPHNNLDSVHVFLKDNYKQTETELTEGVSYSFEINADTASKGERRFVLNFVGKQQNIVQDSNNGQGVQIGPNPVQDELIIRLSNDAVSSSSPTLVRVFTMEGKLLQAQQAAVGTQLIHVRLGNETKEVLMIEVKNDKVSTVQKIIKY
ncbi:MAG: VCBS repeat-containing protein [Bacteroidota bacterium]|nr:VCBS repeat-containing protein [Bacteroidota bacterium]